MKKLRLDLEKLAVESFATAAEDGDARGTVHGHLPTTTGPLNPNPFSDSSCAPDICSCQP